MSTPSSVYTSLNHVSKITKPKRLRTCNNCRKNHIKCDSQQPCSNCVIRKLSCEYSVRKKRISKPSEREKQLESELMKLKAEIERLKHAQQQYQQYQQKCTSLQMVTAVCPTRNRFRDLNTFSLMSVLYHVLHHKSIILSNVPTEVIQKLPEIFNAILLGTEDSYDPRDRLLGYGLMGACCIKTNQLQKLKSLFYENVFNLINNIKTPDIVVACALAFLVPVTFSFGEIEKMNYCARTSISLFERLNEQKHPLYRFIMILRVFIEASYKAKKQALKIASDPKVVFFMGSHEKVVQFGLEMLSLNVELEKEGKFDALKILQTCDKLQDPDFFQNNFFGHEHAKSKLISVVELILTRAYLRAGLKFAALKYAEKVHQFLSTIDASSGLNPFVGVLGIGTLCDAFIAVGRWKEFDSTIQIAKNFAKMFPVFSLIVGDYEARVGRITNGNTKESTRFFKIATIGSFLKEDKNLSDSQSIIPSSELEEDVAFDLVLGPSVNLFDSEFKQFDDYLEDSPLHLCATPTELNDQKNL